MGNLINKGNEIVYKTASIINIVKSAVIALILLVIIIINTFIFK